MFEVIYRHTTVPLCRLVFGGDVLEAYLLGSKATVAAIYWQQQFHYFRFSVPAKDIYHDTVKRALQKGGWTITHDSSPLQIGKKRLSADLGAERLISAERGLQRIVVEVKSFVGQSDVKDLEQSIPSCDPNPHQFDW